ncbi:MAG TPA: hypothetical protein VGD59_00450 [Acidisarcina sp.]
MRRSTAAGSENMFEQAILAVEDQPVFGEVQQALERVFAPADVGKFLRRVDRARLRVRNFEGILKLGLLGEKTPSQYEALGNSDRGQVREQYLRLVEQVAPELRAKYLKVYAYY